ncbi:MAG: FAD:protein FMN transferase [Phycisphaerales bacterium]|nr:FAD:protein FMN transferase [Phycisphaerales bacterium]
MNIRLATEAMGTRFELVLHGEDEFFLRAAGEEAIQLIHEQHARLSAFSESSLVWRLNALAAQRPVEVDREVWELLSLCAQVWQLSGGAFDPAIGSLMKRWGFRGQASAGHVDAPHAGFAHVELDAARKSARFHHPEVALDFGAVAKGFALDLAAARLRELGVSLALLHGGTSTSVAIGSPFGQPGWRIRIPGPEPIDLPVTACLSNLALSVSSPSGRTVQVGAETRGHIMDPGTGEPAASGKIAAVAGGSGAATDAWSTALIVLGSRPASMPTGLASACWLSGQSWIIEPPGASVFVI